MNLANHPTRIVLDLGCTRSIGSRTAIERFKKHARYYGIAMEFCRCNESFVFANSETGTCKESSIIHFPTIPQCSTKVNVLETSDVPILFSLSQVKNLGITNELDPKGDEKLHFQLLVCIPLQLSTPQCYPAHAPDMDEDEDEHDKPLVRPASRKEPAKEKRDLDTDDEDLLPLVPPRPPPVAPVRKRKGPPVWQDPAASEQKIPQFGAEKQKVKPYATS